MPPVDDSHDLDTLIKQTRHCDYDELIDLSDLLRHSLGHRVARHGKPPPRMTEMAANALELTKRHQEQLLQIAQLVADALKPVPGDGQGHAQVKYIRRPKWDSEKQEWSFRYFGPYCYLRYWETKGGRNHDQKILRNVYLGKELGVALENEWVTSDEIVKAYNEGRIEELKERFKTHDDR